MARKRKELACLTSKVHEILDLLDLSLEKPALLAEQGAYIELCLYSAMPISGRVTAAGFA